MVLLVGWTLAACSALWFAVRVKQGLLPFETSDEMEHYVVAMMLNRGHRLYGDVFSHHGPLPYMIAQLYTGLISDSDFSYSRLSLAIMALISCAAVVFNPALSSIMGRIWAGAIYLLMLASTWIIEGTNTLNYWTVSGLLFVIVAAQFSLAGFVVKAPHRFGTIAAGAAATLACFSSYSNGPAAISLILAPLMLIFFSPDRRSIAIYLKRLGAGSLISLLLIGLWFWRFGDLKGFFVYHFYFNQEVYARYINFTPLSSLARNLDFSLSPYHIVHSLALCMLVFSLYTFVSLKPSNLQKRSWLPMIAALVLLALGALLTNPRAILYLVDSSFVLVVSALFSVAGAMLLERNLFRPSTKVLLHGAAILFAIAFLFGQAIAHATTWIGVPQNEIAAHASTMKESESPIYKFVRSITRSEDDFLVLSYNTIIYSRANRLPASGHLFYLPWQAEYNKHPKLGYKIDLCSDISRKRPSAIWFFNRYTLFQRATELDYTSIDEYEPCVISLLKEGYTALSFSSPWYIRNDLFMSAAHRAPRGADADAEPTLDSPAYIQRSSVLSAYTPIKLTMTPAHHKRNLPLKRIGIMLTTYARKNFGEAILRLKGPGSEIVVPFELPTLGDNEYRYFALDSGRYMEGEIASSAGGISTWEGVNYSQFIYTCLIYEYVDGSRKYTPGCPL
jgi:hypothetical protein